MMNGSAAAFVKSADSAGPQEQAGSRWSRAGQALIDILVILSILVAVLSVANTAKDETPFVLEKTGLTAGCAAVSLLAVVLGFLAGGVSAGVKKAARIIYLAALGACALLTAWAIGASLGTRRFDLYDVLAAIWCAANIGVFIYGMATRDPEGAYRKIAYAVWIVSILTVLIALIISIGFKITAKSPLVVYDWLMIGWLALNAGLMTMRGVREKAFVSIARDWQLYIMLIPPVLFYLIFCYKPMLGVMMAFQKFNPVKGMWGSTFIGIKNFEDVMRLSDFMPALVNTLWLNLLGLVAGFPVPIVLAIMLNELKAVGYKKVSQTLLYLPHFLSWIIIGGMALQIFAPKTGVINATFLKWGWIDKSIPFLTDGPTWQGTYTVIGIWQNMGWGTILYLSAITGINMELFEAAKIDGANKMQQIWHVTLPGIRSTIAVLLILNVGQMMNISFDRPFILGNPGVRDYCDVLSTFVYRIGIDKAQYARATAIGLFQSLVGLILISSANFAIKKLGEEGIW